MQQRRLRLGDIVDDYCPRERRITNHAIVAMIEDKVKQTRCTTCDAEHEYRQARVPAQRRKKDGPPSLLADASAASPRRHISASEADGIEPPDFEPAEVGPPAETAEPPMAAAPETADGAAPVDEAAAPATEDEGPVHRRLIRATLPRPEGQAPERKLPEFTIHQRDANGNRPGRGRHRRGPRANQMRPQHGSNGQSSRFGGQRQGPHSRHGSGHGFEGQRPQGQRPPGQRQHGGNRAGHGQPGQQRPNRGRKRGR